MRNSAIAAEFADAHLEAHPRARGGFGEDHPPAAVPQRMAARAGRASAFISPPRARMRRISSRVSDSMERRFFIGLRRSILSCHLRAGRSAKISTRRVDLAGGDVQRRQPAHAIRARRHQQQARPPGSRSTSCRRGRAVGMVLETRHRGDSFGVEFDAEHQAASAHVVDRRGPSRLAAPRGSCAPRSRLFASSPSSSMVASVSRLTAQPSGVPPKVVPCEPGPEQVGRVDASLPSASVTARSRTQKAPIGKPAAMPFAQPMRVGHDLRAAERMPRAPIARSPEAALDFVEHQEQIPLVAQPAQPAQKFRRRRG